MGVAEGVLQREVLQRLPIKARWGGWRCLRRRRAGSSAGLEAAGTEAGELCVPGRDGPTSPSCKARVFVGGRTEHAAGAPQQQKKEQGQRRLQIPSASTACPFIPACTCLG